MIELQLLLKLQRYREQVQEEKVNLLHVETQII